MSKVDLYKGQKVILRREGQIVYQREDGSIGVDSCDYAETMTQQQYQSECDINNIMKSYVQTGELPLKQRVGQFMDVSNVGSFHEMMNQVIAAEDAFMQFPAQLRSKFENDPQKMYEWLSDDKNYEEALSLGLVDEKKAEVRKRSATGKPAAEKPAQPPSETKPSS